MLQPHTLDSIVQKMADLYVSNRKRFVIMSETCYVPNRRLSDAELKHHIEGDAAIVIYAGPKASKFVCFDIDDGQQATAQAVMEALVAFGFPFNRIYLSTSGGKGYHGEVFFDAFAYTDQLQRLYRWMLHHTGLSARQVEFRPTEGQAVKLPLCRHHRTGNMCWYLDRNTFAPIQSFDYIMEIERIPESDVIRMCHENAGVLDTVGSKGKLQANKHKRTTKMKREDKAHNHKRLPIHDGNQYRQMTGPNSRHTMMCDIAVHQRHSGVDRETCHGYLVAWYGRQDKSLIHSSREVVMDDIRKIVDWAYGDGFTLGGAYGWHGEGRISHADMRYVIRQPTRSMRKVCFLLVARIRAHCAPVSYQSMAKVAGVSKQTVITAIQRLLAEGSLQCKEGRRWMAEAGFKCQPNAYTLDKTGLPEAQDGMVVRGREL